MKNAEVKCLVEDIWNSVKHSIADDLERKEMAVVVLEVLEEYGVSKLNEMKDLWEDAENNPEEEF